LRVSLFCNELSSQRTEFGIERCCSKPVLFSKRTCAQASLGFAIRVWAR
jgi:hypothetical protein